MLSSWKRVMTQSRGETRGCWAVEWAVLARAQGSRSDEVLSWGNTGHVELMVRFSGVLVPSA